MNYDARLRNLHAREQKLKKQVLLGDLIGHEEQDGFNDAFMGLGEKKANYNEVMEIGEVVAKRRAQNVKDRAAVMNRMKEWQKQKLK